MEFTKQIIVANVNVKYSTCAPSLKLTKLIKHSEFFIWIIIILFKMVKKAIHLRSIKLKKRKRESEIVI